ncbi:MAG: hypothetical protein AAFY35_09480 [Pseudomonadota bacterium]
MKFVAISACLGALVTPALACPTIEDLSKGIEFRTDGGDIELHRQLRPGWVTTTVTFSDGDGSVLELYQGMYLLSSIPMEKGLPKPGDREDYATTAELRQWMRPVPNNAWVNDTPGGGKATSGLMETITIGGCAYNSFKVIIQFNDDDTYKETYDYLSDLGVGLLIKTEASDGTDTYVYTGVRALP